MITFQGKEIELDKSLYVICGTYATVGSVSLDVVKQYIENQKGK